MATTTITQDLHDMLFSENYAITVELMNTDHCINSRELYHLRKYTSKTCNLLTTSLIDKTQWHLQTVHEIHRYSTW